MTCEEVQKMTDDAELTIMMRASKEGLSPSMMQTILKFLRAGDPLEQHIACMEGMGYEDRKMGKPNLCAGTPCLDEGAEYVQFWNENMDGMFLLKKETKNDVSTMPGPYGLRIGISQENRMSSYFVGSEKDIEESGIPHEPMDCPETKGGCNGMVKIYEVFNIPQTYFEGMGADSKAYKKIMSEELGKLALKKREYCTTQCPLTH